MIGVKNMKIFALLFFLLVVPTQLIACSCRGDWSIEMASTKYSNIALVKIISSHEVVETEELWSVDAGNTNPDEEPTLEKVEIRSIFYTGNIMESLKGDHMEKIEILGELGSNCTISMLEGETYLVFWSGRVATTSLCTKQPLLSDVPLDFLNKIRNRH